jgi:Fe-S cluster biosynthesis and repair protein YggX
MLDRE